MTQIIGTFRAARGVLGLHVIPRYLLLTLLLLAITRALAEHSRKRAFWLGFSVTCALHVVQQPAGGFGEYSSWIDATWIAMAFANGVFGDVPKGITQNQVEYFIWPPVVLLFSFLAGLLCAAAYGRWVPTVPANKHGGLTKRLQRRRRAVVGCL